MDNQIAAALLTAGATLGLPMVRVLSKMTVQARAEGQLRRADLFRRAGVDDEAAEHDRRARRFLLRPVVMEERGLVGTIARADLAALGLLIAAGAIAIAGSMSLASSFTGGGMTLAAIALMLHETIALERECTRRAATYDPKPAGRAGPPVRHRVVSTAVLGYSILQLIRRPNPVDDRLA